MVRAALFALVVGSVGSSALALPVAPQAHFAAQPDRFTEVKIICTEDGICDRPPGRRPVARWVYGDRAFFGPLPYSGPGYYGWPGAHWRWLTFFGY
jgi:hypothetical protein